MAGREETPDREKPSASAEIRLHERESAREDEDLAALLGRDRSRRREELSNGNDPWGKNIKKGSSAALP